MRQLVEIVEMRVGGKGRRDEKRRGGARKPEHPTILTCARGAVSGYHWMVASRALQIFGFNVARKSAVKPLAIRSWNVYNRLRGYTSCGPTS
jgi:hypothetical protein